MRGSKLSREMSYTKINPTIGLLCDIDNDKVTSLFNTYVSAIVHTGGVPIMLPYVKDSDVMDRYIRLCDGFVFTGGVDVDPAHYGEDKSEFCGEIQPFRDELEFAMFPKIFSSNKPILAICRGAQFVNAALGGTLYQDIPSEYETGILHRQTEGKNEFSHDVVIKKDTPLHELVGSLRMKANSFHHQAIKKAGHDLVPMAYADDGIIEALYHTEHVYLRAYQWHPERLFEKSQDNNAIFSDFIGACHKIKRSL